MIAEARNYELTEDENSRKLSDFFWHTMIDYHTFAPGCSSDKEHYFDPARFSKQGQEICHHTGLRILLTQNMVVEGPFIIIRNGSIGCPAEQMTGQFQHIIGTTRFPGIT